MLEKFSELYRKYPDRMNCAIIVLAALICFLPSLSYETFVLDDSAYVGSSYLFTLSWSNIKYILTSKTVGLYSPLVILSFIPDYTLWGGELFHAGCRFQNILWHSGAMVLFYLILREINVKFKNETEISFPPVVALLAALAAAVHPQRVESVVWIAERKDVMVLTLGMSVIYAFIKAYKADKISILAPVLLFISLAAVKPLMLSLPVIITIGYLVVKRPFDLKDFARKVLPLYGAAAVYMLLNWKIYADFGSGMASSAAGGDGESRIFTAFYNIWLYFAKTLFPVKLNPCYPLYRPGEVSFWAMALLLATAVTAIVFSLVKNPWKEFFARAVVPAGLLYGAAVFPVCNLQRIGNVDFADRYSYFPSLFVLMILAAALTMIYRNFPESRRTVKLIPAVFLGALLLVTATYMPAWKTKKSQIDAMLDTPHPHLGALKIAASDAFKNNKIEETLSYVRIIQDAKTGHPADVYFIEGMLGLIQISQGNADAGVARINAFLSKPDWFYIVSSPADFVRNCIVSSATWHLKQKRDPQHKQYAANLFEMAAQAIGNWNVLESMNYRAIAMLIRGELHQAEAIFAQALKLVPGDENIRKNLLAVRQRISEAASTAPVEKSAK